jgi:hypothetical protein
MFLPNISTNLQNHAEQSTVKNAYQLKYKFNLHEKETWLKMFYIFSPLLQWLFIDANSVHGLLKPLGCGVYIAMLLCRVEGVNRDLCLI